MENKKVIESASNEAVNSKQSLAKDQHSNQDQLAITVLNSPKQKSKQAQNQQLQAAKANSVQSIKNWINSIPIMLRPFAEAIFMAWQQRRINLSQEQIQRLFKSFVTLSEQMRASNIQPTNQLIVVSQPQPGVSLVKLLSSYVSFDLTKFVSGVDILLPPDLVTTVIHSNQLGLGPKRLAIDPMNIGKPPLPPISVNQSIPFTKAELQLYKLLKVFTGSEVVLYKLLKTFEGSEATVLKIFTATKRDAEVTQALVPILAAERNNDVPKGGLTVNQFDYALHIYSKSGNIKSVQAWLKSGNLKTKGRHNPNKNLTFKSPIAGVGAGYFGPYPELHPKGTKAKELDNYRKSYSKLNKLLENIKVNIVNANEKLYKELEKDIKLTNEQAVKHRNRIDYLTFKDIEFNQEKLDFLHYYLKTYVKNDQTLTDLDTYNTVKHNASIGVLWNSWKNNRFGKTGKAEFDILIKTAIPNIKWNADKGAHKPDATLNPITIKQHLGKMQSAVLNGLINNLGTLKGKLNRGKHNTIPTGGKGNGGTEYNAVTNIQPNVANWENIAGEPNPPGAQRFIYFNQKWFYVPNHYMGPKGWAGPAAYQLIIDA